MTSSRSVRARFLLGSTLWTIGALAIAHMLSIVLMHHMPSMREWNHGLVIAMALVFVGLGAWQLRGALTPLQRLRTRVLAVREGREKRIEGDYPAEVDPLVHDLNALLEHREKVVARALAKAGDLAHGLKTPLAVLAQEAALAEKRGETELAAAIRREVERMRRHVDYHLAHARAAASGAAPGARAEVLAAADGLARTMLRLHAERPLDLRVEVAADHAVRVEREDLEEMLGNLFDNACKWARSRVVVASSIAGSTIVITVDDDGPGLAPELRERVLQRGVRADEAAPGSGLGLAIVRELAELYGGSVMLERSAAGGVRARLTLPSC